MNENWRWCGHAHHFIGANSCRFHLCTWVGDYLVSTVGDYRPHGERRTLGIGAEDWFETMVFPAERVDDPDDRGLCHGYRITGDSEVLCERYADAETANGGHLRLCFKFGALRGTEF